MLKPLGDRQNRMNSIAEKPRAANTTVKSPENAQIFDSRGFSIENNEELLNITRSGGLIRLQTNLSDDFSSSSDDGDDDYSQQVRLTQKTGKPLSFSRVGQTSDEAKKFEESPRVGLRVRPRQVVMIQDFDFNPPNVEMAAGKLMMKLADILINFTCFLLSVLIQTPQSNFVFRTTRHDMLNIVWKGKV